MNLIYEKVLLDGENMPTTRSHKTRCLVRFLTLAAMATFPAVMVDVAAVYLFSIVISMWLPPIGKPGEHLWAGQGTALLVAAIIWLLIWAWREDSNKSCCTSESCIRLAYTITLRKDTDGDIVARIEELPGCSAHGSDETEAINNVKEALRLWIEDCLESGDPVPIPDASLRREDR